MRRAGPSSGAAVKRTWRQVWCGLRLHAEQRQTAAWRPDGRILHEFACARCGQLLARFVFDAPEEQAS